MRNMAELNAIGAVSQISYPNYEFDVFAEGDEHACLQIICHGTDTRDPTVSHTWKGRKWIISKHMTRGEVVQTAFMAVMAANEHEARELFKYKGASVFDPHYDLDKLLALRQQPDAIVERGEAPVWTVINAPDPDDTDYPAECYYAVMLPTGKWWTVVASSKDDALVEARAFVDGGYNAD